MTAKEKLHHLVDALTEDQAEAVLPILEARVTPDDNAWANGRKALTELRALTADLPPFDAVAAAADARRELEQRPQL